MKTFPYKVGQKEVEAFLTSTKVMFSVRFVGLFVSMNMGKKLKKPYFHKTLMKHWLRKNPLHLRSYQMNGADTSIIFHL